MSEILTKENFVDVKRDIEDIGKSANEDVIVDPRYGNSYKSIPMLSRLFQALIDAGYQDLNELNQAIQIAYAAGAGANGWTANLVVDGDKTQKQINDFVFPKLKEQFVSIWDFFTAEEYAAYKAAPTTFDAYRPVQEFFDYISANDVGVAYCSGTVYVSQGIVFGGASGSKTKQVIGEFHLCALPASVIHTLFLLQTGEELKWLGLINVNGLGGIWYGWRSVRRGLVLGGANLCTHTYITQVNATNGFIEYGVLIDNLTTGYNIDNIRVTRCGSGLDYANEGASLYADFTLVSEVISDGTSQSSTLSVNTLPPEGLLVRPMLEIDGEVYDATVNYANSTVHVFPLIKRGVTSGRLKWVFGAGVASVGGDASVGRIGKINSTSCGIVYYPSALYPATIGALTSESNYATVALGSSRTAALVGGSIDSFYTESNKFDIIRRTGYTLNLHITTNVAFDFKKFYDMTGARNSTTGHRDASAVGSNGIVIGYSGQNVSWENGAGARNISAAVSVTDFVRTELFFYANTRTISIIAPDAEVNAVTGLNRKPVVVVGTGNNGNPTGDIIFNAPAGYTVNGQSSVTFNGFTQAAKFDVYLQFNRNNFVVVCTTLEKKALLASVTYDPPSIAANSSITTTVALPSATVGSVVQAAFNQYNADIEISAVVSAANTVTVKFKNTGAAAVDLASGTLTVKLI